MCLIFLAYNAHPRYRLIMAANRDEFYARPTAPAAFWKESPNILAGRDLIHGGTWLGITTTGRLAAVTNYREQNFQTSFKSRGDLPRDFLAGNQSTGAFLSEIEDRKNEYSGFNLLSGVFTQHQSELFYFSNRQKHGIKKLLPGIYGLSNHLLDTNWYKVETGKAKFEKLLGERDEVSPADLFEILGDRSLAADAKLPATGIDIERERILSAAFIETGDYGTRSSTVLLIEASGKCTFLEKSFYPNPGDRQYGFLI